MLHETDYADIVSYVQHNSVYHTNPLATSSAEFAVGHPGMEGDDQAEIVLDDEVSQSLSLSAHHVCIAMCTISKC